MDFFFYIESQNKNGMFFSALGKHMWGVVTVNDRRQIVIPKEARETFGLVNGSRLVVLGDDNEGIALVKAEQFEEKLSMAMSVLSKDIKE